MFELTYAHCTKYTPGELDVAPYSEYAFRTVYAEMFRLVDRSKEEYFRIEVDGRVFGEGETKIDAAGDAQYWLMNASRNSASAVAAAV